MEMPNLRSDLLRTRSATWEVLHSRSGMLHQAAGTATHRHPVNTTEYNRILRVPGNVMDCEHTLLHYNLL